MGYIDFYQRVKSLSKINKMTIEYTVGQAGLSIASYNAYRRHKNLPRADEALKIAQALKTSVEYLVTGTEPEPTALDEVLEKILAVINQYKK